VARRQELAGEYAGVTVVIDDFAHHPTAVRGRIAAHPRPLSEESAVGGLRAALEHQPSQGLPARVRRGLRAADRVVVQIVLDAPIYSAFGGEPERLSAEQLARDVSARGIPAVALPDVDAIVDHLAKSCAPGDVVVTLSNGGFGGIWGKLLERLGGGT
jgi:UDP-N-acetylmuramate: L-alanyl-gamma-D-glutamyl-meso-diaminopimelate ligase